MHPSQTFSSVEVDVLSIHTHPEFHPANLYNDIAIVKLDGAVDLAANPHISPVCLPDTFQVRGVELKMRCQHSKISRQNFISSKTK